MPYRCIKNGSECDGCGECKEPLPKCPICGQECDKFYKHDGEVVGCENCISEVESYGSRD